MDEQNPRLAGDTFSGRADETTRGLEADAAERRTASRTAVPTSYVPGGTSMPPSSRRDASSPAEADTPAEPRTRELRSEIEQTRGELTETVNAIQERLRPANIAANAKDTVTAAARQTARGVTQSEPVEYVRANPIATTMVGIGVAGLAMLAFGGRESRSNGRGKSRRQRDWRTGTYDRGEMYGSPAYRSYEETGFSGYESADVYTPGLGAGGSGVDADEPSHRSEPLRAVRDRVEQAWQRSPRAADASHYLQRTWDQNPLIIGAAAAVMGALVGLAVPETERENQMMGEARDNVVETVQGTVRDKVNQVQEAATDAVNTVKDVASTAAGITDTGSESRRG